MTTKLTQISLVLHIVTAVCVCVCLVCTTLSHVYSWRHYDCQDTEQFLPPSPQQSLLCSLSLKFSHLKNVLYIKKEEKNVI